MAFVVEDGTGLENANAYVDVAFVDSYVADRGASGWTGDATAKEQAIVRATDYVDNRFRGRFRGRTLTSSQALEWPREGAYDYRGTLLEGIPTQLKKAVAEYAIRAVSGALMPDPTFDASGQSVRRKREKVGPLEEETEFHGSGQVILQSYPAADRLLFGLLADGQGRQIRA